MKRKTKNCLLCGEEYRPTGGGQKYCLGCALEAKRKYFREYMANRRAAHPREPKFRFKVCLNCAQIYAPVTGHEKYCPECGVKKQHERVKRGNIHFYKTHRETEIARSLVYDTSHRKEQAASAAAYRIAHPEAGKLWVAANPVKRSAIARRNQAKRRVLGFVSLNSPFVGCEGHHINVNDVIYLPRKLHRSIYHNQWTGQGMAEMNVLAGQYLTEDWT
jgi:hypothetical protein